MTYWYEGEVEAEWEKTKLRSRKETGQFSYETSASEAMMQASQGLTLDQRNVANTAGPDGQKDSNKWT